MVDEKIIELFFERSEQALKEVDIKYGRTCHNISYNILHNDLDAEECVNDAYLGAWNAIPPARPNPLLTFLCKIVRNISLKRYELNTAIKRNSTYDIAIEKLNNAPHYMVPILLLASVFTSQINSLLTQIKQGAIRFPALRKQHLFVWLLSFSLHL